MIRQRIVAGLVAGVALVGLTACGSDSESSDSTAAVAKATTTDAAATTTAGGETATSIAGSATTDSNISIPDVTTPELTGNCVELGKQMESVFGDDFNPTTASQDDINDVFDQLKTEVPNDLEDDVETLRDAVLPFYAAMAKVDGDMTKALQDPEVQQAMTAMNSADVQAASTALDEWTANGCPSS